MIQAIDPKGDVVYCVCAMGMKFYCEKRSLVTNLEVVNCGPGAQVPKLNMIIEEAWTSALNRVEDVTIHGGYIAYPETPTFWKNRDIPKRAAEPQKTSNVIQM